MTLAKKIVGRKRHIDAAAVARMFDSALASYGGVDILVNNAGIMKLAALAESDDALFDNQVAVNLKRAHSTLCVRPPSGSAAAAGSLTCPPAWSG